MLLFHNLRGRPFSQWVKMVVKLEVDLDIHRKETKDFILLAENYIIFRKYIKCVLLPLTEMMGLIMNLISRIHYFCEIREYAFNVFPKYDTIILYWLS